MKKVAKLVMIDNADNYLLMYRSNHPLFGDDPDIPGGLVEDGESGLEAVIREALEETGMVVDRDMVREVYAGTEYSAHGTHRSLFVVRLSERPEIVKSWEHSGYEWLDRDEFLKKAKSANDTFMHMVYDLLKDL